MYDATSELNLKMQIVVRILRTEPTDHVHRAKVFSCNGNKALQDVAVA